MAKRFFSFYQDLSTPHLFAHACFGSSLQLDRFISVLKRDPSKAALVRTLSGYETIDSDVTSVLEGVTGDIPLLPNLVALSRIRYLPSTFTCINHLLVQCPSLEELNLFWNCGSQADVPRLQLVALPTVQSLKLRGFLLGDTFLSDFLGNPSWSASSPLTHFELDRADWVSEPSPPPLPSTLLTAFLGWVGPNLTSLIIKNAPFPSSLVALCPIITVLGLRDLDLDQPPFPSLHHPHVTTVHLSRPPLDVLSRARSWPLSRNASPLWPSSGWTLRRRSGRRWIRIWQKMWILQTGSCTRSTSMRRMSFAGRHDWCCRALMAAAGRSLVSGGQGRTLKIGSSISRHILTGQRCQLLPHAGFHALPGRRKRCH